MSDTPQSIVTLADHEAGFKEIEVTFRNGQLRALRLSAPPRRKARGLGVRVARDNDPWPVVEACLPDGTQEEFVDRLEPVSADLVEYVALALTFGWPFQKKMETAGLGAMTDWTTPEPRSPSSPAGSH